MSDVELREAAELSMCPFCGNDHIAIGYSDDGHTVSCFRGDPCCKSSTGIWPTEAEAIAAWNRRAPDPRLEAAERQLRALIEADNDNTGAEPSQGVFDREIERARAFLNRKGAKDE